MVNGELKMVFHSLFTVHYSPFGTTKGKNEEQDQNTDRRLVTAFGD